MRRAPELVEGAGLQRSGAERESDSKAIAFDFPKSKTKERRSLTIPPPFRSCNFQHLISIPKNNNHIPMLQTYTKFQFPKVLSFSAEIQFSKVLFFRSPGTFPEGELLFDKFTMYHGEIQVQWSFNKSPLFFLAGG